MKKKKLINNLFYFLLGGIILGGFGVFAATSLQSNSILYDNSTSGGTSTNVKGALDELYNLAILYVYSVSDKFIKLEDSISGEVTTYDNYQDAINAFGHPFFKRYTVNNNKIIDIHIGFVKDGNVYYLRWGGATYNYEYGNYYNDSIYYDTNKATLISAFGSENCTDKTTNLDCSVSDLRATATMSGAVYASDFSYYCNSTIYGTTCREGT